MRHSDARAGSYKLDYKKASIALLALTAGLVFNGLLVAAVVTVIEKSSLTPLHLAALLIALIVAQAIRAARTSLRSSYESAHTHYASDV